MPHGTYARKSPDGVRVRRFRCPQTGRTVSLLPDCLAAHHSGTLAEFERAAYEATRAERAHRKVDLENRRVARGLGRE